METRPPPPGPTRAAATGVVARVKSAFREAMWPLPLVAGIAMALTRSRREPTRPHRGLGQRIPASTTRKTSSDASEVVAVPILGGLHHGYRAAA